GFRWGESDSLRALADACRHLGEFAEAERLYEESLLLKREIGHQRGVALTLISLGDLAQRKGDHVRARAHYREALQVAIEIQSPPVILTSLLGWGEVLAQVGQQEKAAALLTFILGHPAAEQQLQDQVCGTLAELKAALSPELADAAEARGRAWTLDEAMASLQE
ncbi:MAG: tetratricopeptide repeat protein, partial [Anaerolineae bacterium]|nr:tetratricopeptide repeat protein [Anaerolineae bacterium]